MGESRHIPEEWRRGTYEPGDKKILVWGESRDGRGFEAEIDCDDQDRDVANAVADLMVASPNLLALARAYEEWEADLILSDEAWAPNGMAPLPRLTQGLYDRLLEIQAMRNAAISKATGKSI
jgi:hypothetical protein